MKGGEAPFYHYDTAIESSLLRLIFAFINRTCVIMIEPVEYPTFSSTAAWSLYFDGSVPPFNLLGMKNESTVAVIFGSTIGRRRSFIHSISVGSNGTIQYRNVNNKDSG